MKERGIGIDDGGEKDLRRWTWDEGWTKMGVLRTTEINLYLLMPAKRML